MYESFDNIGSQAGNHMELPLKPCLQNCQKISQELLPDFLAFFRMKLGTPDFAVTGNRTETFSVAGPTDEVLRFIRLYILKHGLDSIL